MQGLDVQDIIALLGPNADPGLPWTIFIYLIFFLAVITMLMQSEKTLLPTLVMAAVIGMAVLDKLQVLNRQEVAGTVGFGTLALHAGMFTLPLIVAGMTKAPKSRPPAILGGIIGGIYFFGYWFFIQRGGGL